MTEAEFDEILRELREDADQATWFIGFLQATVANNDDIMERLARSWAGFAGVTARAGVKNSVILYCARAWDRAGDAVSLRRAVDNLPALRELEARRHPLTEALLEDVPEGALAERHQRFMTNYQAALDKPYHPSIRLLRTEYFAHRLLESDERRMLVKSNIVIPDATYDDLLELAKATVSLVGQVGYLWDRLSDPYPARIQRATRFAREFWRLLPVLSEVEQVDY